jgi:hypothetical protein
VHNFRYKKNSSQCNYLDRGLKLQEDWLGNEDFASLRAEITDFCLQELYLFAWSAASNFQQSIDDGIEVYIVLVRHCFYPLMGRGHRGRSFGFCSIEEIEVVDYVGRSRCSEDCDSLPDLQRVTN